MKEISLLTIKERLREYLTIGEKKALTQYDVLIRKLRTDNDELSRILKEVK